jgi:hypothetical protein
MIKLFSKKRPLISVLLLLIFSTLTNCSSSYEEFQINADIVKLNHLNYYGNLLNEYKTKTGKYPFQGEERNLPIYIYVANDEQIEGTKPGPPFSHREIGFQEFVEEVEKELGKEILEYYDPQYRPDAKPNFYMYMIRNNTYFFAIHVHRPYPFARKIADGYYKIELSNNPSNDNKAQLWSNLVVNPEFIKELNKPIEKEDFFKERENKYLHYTKSFE